MQTEYEPDPKKYSLLSEIGSCSNGHGRLYLAKHNSQQLVIKITQLDAIDLIDHQKNLKRLRELRHPNLISCFGSFVPSPHTELWSLHPVMSHGSARDLLDDHYPDGFPEPLLVVILYSLLHAVEYLHRKGYIHRAIKGSHVLLSSSSGVCLSGLQYGCNLIYDGKYRRYVHEFPKNCKENLNWLAPEILEQNLQGYNEKSDLYCFGITALELASGNVPFEGLPPSLMLLEKLHGAIPHLTARLRASETQHEGNSKLISAALAGFVSLCVDRNPASRTTIAHLISHPFLRSAKKGAISLTSILSDIPAKVTVGKDEVIDETKRLACLEIGDTIEWEF